MIPSFYRTPLQELIVRAKIDKNDSFKSIFKRKVYINKKVDFEIKERLYGVIDNFVTALILGKQGTFKSNVGLELLKKTSLKKTTINDTAFLYEKFRDNIEHSDPGKSNMLDEQVFIHGTGSVRIVEESQNLIETLRKRQNSMVVVGVEGKYFPEEIFTFVMETVDTAIMGVCTKKVNLHEVRTCPFCLSRQHDIKKVYVRLAVREKDHYIGFYVVESDWNNPLWKDYSIEKDKFMEIAKAQDFMKLDYEGRAKEFLKDPEIVNYKKNQDLKLYLEKKIPNITIEEKNLLVRQIRILRIENEGGKL